MSKSGVDQRANSGIGSVETATQRRVLRRHAAPFLSWLEETGRERQALDHIAADLASFLIKVIEDGWFESAAAPVEFWKRIPEVLACCNDPAVFEKPFSAEAYAYVHLLERYRRTWATLKHLSESAVLPLGRYGVRVLDIGTGPAPSLYAIDDFYGALIEYAHAANIPELQLPAPGLNCVERSQAMVRFFHRFSEFSKRRGPLRAAFSNFAGLSLKDTRAWHRRQNEVAVFWNPDTKEYEEEFDPDAAAVSDALFRYRLVVLSNFLTLESNVKDLEAELSELFRDLRPGAVVIVLGGTGDSYQRIYDLVDALARGAGLSAGRWDNDTLPRLQAEDAAARLIKESQYRVYLRLEQLVGAASLQRHAPRPDYWSPTPSRRAGPRFALRVFRRGRWPEGARTKRGKGSRSLGQ